MKPYNCKQTNDHYWVEIITWNHITMHKLSILDMNTWNYTNGYKLWVLDRNIWYHITVQKPLMKQLYIKCRFKNKMNVNT